MHLEHLEGETEFHIAVFGRTARQASAAAALLRLTWNVKGTQVFDRSGNRLATGPATSRVLDCFSKANLVQ